MFNKGKYFMYLNKNVKNQSPKWLIHWTGLWMAAFLLLTTSCGPKLSETQTEPPQQEQAPEEKVPKQEKNS